ncbi:MAG: antitoxin [Solirubrobacterales bacterium]
MRTTLEIDDDVITAARELAAVEGKSLGSVVSDLVRKGLTPTKVDSEDGIPVIRVPAGSSPITPEMVRRALDED